MSVHIAYHARIKVILGQIPTNTSSSNLLALSPTIATSLINNCNPISTQEDLQSLIKLLFQWAIRTKSRAPAATHLLTFIASKTDATILDPSVLDKSGKPMSAISLVRYYLMKHCQEHFYMAEELGSGYITLIAELYSAELVSLKAVNEHFIYRLKLVEMGVTKGLAVGDPFE